MLSFKLDNDTKFEFSMQITGDADSPAEPEVLFVICYGDYRFGVKATYMQNGVYSVIVPPLKGIIPPGVHKAAVWVLIGDRFYKPHEADVEFKMDLKPVVSDFKGQTVKASEPTISFTPPSSGPEVTIVAPMEAKTETKTDKKLEEHFIGDVRGLKLSTFLMKREVKVDEGTQENAVEIVTEFLKKQTNDYTSAEISNIVKKLREFLGIKEAVVEEKKPDIKPTEMLEKLLKKGKK
jgi:hypothetical protein